MKTWPKTLYVRQTTVATGATRTFTSIAKNQKAENNFRWQAAGMLPNFSHEISTIPFSEDDCAGARYPADLT